MMGPVAAVCESVSGRQQTFKLHRHRKDGRVRRVGETHRRSVSITSARDAFDEDAYSTRPLPVCVIV